MKTHFSLLLFFFQLYRALQVLQQHNMLIHQIDQWSMKPGSYVYALNFYVRRSLCHLVLCLTFSTTGFPLLAHKAVLLRLRFPTFSAYTLRVFGTDCQRLLEEIFLHGQYRLVNLFAQYMPPPGETATPEQM